MVNWIEKRDERILFFGGGGGLSCLQYLKLETPKQGLY